MQSDIQTKHFIEAKLRKQKEESEMDSKWLQQQEDNIKKRLSINSAADSNEMEMVQSMHQMKAADLYSSINAKQMSNSDRVVAPTSTISSPAMKKQTEPEQKVYIIIFLLKNT